MQLGSLNELIAISRNRLAIRPFEYDFLDWSRDTGKGDVPLIREQLGKLAWIDIVERISQDLLLSPSVGREPILFRAKIKEIFPTLFFFPASSFMNWMGMDEEKESMK